MDRVEIKRFNAQDRDWLVALHADSYARDAGFDVSFGPLVAGILDDFLAQNDPAREAGWIAWRGDQRLGSIFCVRVSAEQAKLRLFILDKVARGQGLGRRLLDHNMQFARGAGYQHMTLWTHESHRAAGALYAATGWTLVSSQPVTSFGQPLIEQHWEITL